VLISRNQTKLDKTAEELHAAYPEIQIQTIAFNFTNTKTEDYESVIFSLLDNLPIGLLGIFNYNNRDY
jgi:short-subunit dehydrogenase